MRVLFILPPFERLMGYERYYTHPGLLSLAAVAEKGNHNVLVYDADYSYGEGNSYNNFELMQHYSDYVTDLNAEKSDIWNEIRDVIVGFNPDFVGISILSVTKESAMKIIKIVKDYNSEIQIIVGGPHVTLQPNDFINYADYVIQGEGEYVINDILANRVHKGVVKGKIVENLDLLPFPATHLLYRIEKYHKRDLSLLMSSRGCCYSCKFCNSSTLWQRKVRKKSVSYFIEEIKRLQETYGICDFYICDDSFSTDREWLRNFCERVKHLNITWKCLDRINHVTRDYIQMMQEAGCRNIKYGIESGSQRILDFVDKNITIDEVYKADTILKESNMNWGAYFMIGFPSETEEDIRKTQELIQNISANEVTLSIFTPYPGTVLDTGEDIDYTKFSHHSPYNNFTNTISDERFHELVEETLNIVLKKKQVNSIYRK